MRYPLVRAKLEDLAEIIGILPVQTQQFEVKDGWWFAYTVQGSSSIIGLKRYKRYLIHKEPLTSSDREDFFIASRF